MPDAPKKPSSRAAHPTLRETNVRRAGPPRLLALKGPVIGIDLGTVNSCVAVVHSGTAEVIKSPGGYETLPSVVHVADDGEVLVGHLARERMVLEPERSVYGAKRFLGRPFASKEVGRIAHFFNYKLVEGPEGRVAAEVAGKVFPLEEVAGHILGRLKQFAQAHLEQPIQRAVITVPAYFGETQRQAVRDAGRHAGLYVERILNEPTAAAVAYGFGRGLSETVLVYDFGGGTFDASVLQIKNDKMEVLASDGDPFLGGSDFDDRLTELVLMTFEREHEIGLRDQLVSVQRVRFAAEMAKKELSESLTTTIRLPYICMGPDGSPVDLETTISRDTLENLTRDLVERTLSITQSVLDAAQIKSSDLDDVILVGGQSRSPAVRSLLYERFRRRPSRRVHPDEAVALGAALIADALGRDQQVELTDILPAAIRVGLRDGTTAVLLPRGVRLPAEKRFEVVLDAASNQYTKVFLYRGQHERAEENTRLGALRLPGLSGQVSTKATITLSVSADGLLSVSAKHPELGTLGELDVLLL